MQVKHTGLFPAQMEGSEVNLKGNHDTDLKLKVIEDNPISDSNLC